MARLYFCSFAGLAAAVVVISGCGGDGAPEGGREPDDRTTLELRLAKTSVGICNGACETFSATAARCTGQGKEVDERTFYRCRVVYGEGGGRRVDTFCAALDEARDYVVRPLADC